MEEKAKEKMKKEIREEVEFEKLVRDEMKVHVCFLSAITHAPAIM